MPRRLREELERLGPTFVKAGQTLSFREQILPPAYLHELARLQDRAAPFAAKVARSEIINSLGKGPDALFASFDDQPLAAASIAQVHCATLFDGRAVVVKVRRPGIVVSIDRDMRALVRVLRVGEWLSARFAKFRPAELAEEVWRNLRRETDFRREARAIRRFGAGFAGSRLIVAPSVIDEMTAEAVLVQTQSHGRLLGDPQLSASGPELARQLAEAYLRQFFVLGFFHGDPHPGNLFFKDDGAICFHDFGIVGELDLTTRRELALFLLGFVHQDAEWMVHSAVELGLLHPGNDRAFVNGVEQILTDYSALPLKDWSIGELFLRVSRLGGPGAVSIPYELLVLVRALFLLENALLRLDPQMNVVEMLRKGGEQTFAALERDGPSAGFVRLRYELAFAWNDLPGQLAMALRSMRYKVWSERAGRHVPHDQSAVPPVERAANRLAMAILVLVLLWGSSQLMGNPAGPHLFGMPALALAGYALATWFGLRIVLAIVSSDHL